MLAAPLLAIAAGCTSTGSGPDRSSLTFPNATFDEVVVAAASAADAVDAAIVDAVNPEPERAALTLVCGWRQPTPESPVLRVAVAAVSGGVRVTVAGEVLAGVSRFQPTDRDSREVRTACDACPKPMRANEMFVPMSNARAMRNLRAATGAFLAALEAELAAFGAVGS